MDAVKDRFSVVRKIVLPGRCKGLYVLGAVIVLAIFAYVATMVLLGKDMASFDVMNSRAFEFNGKVYSWWPVSHLVTFFVMGFFFPTCTVPAILGGILWEAVELVFWATASMNATQVQEDGSIQYEMWWGASWMDVFMNVIGFFLGKIVRIEFDLLTLGGSPACCN